MGGRKGELQGVLGLLSGAEHVPGEGQQSRGVALEEDREGLLVAPADLLDKPLVRGQGQQATGAKDPRDRRPELNRSCTHAERLLPVARGVNSEVFPNF